MRRKKIMLWLLLLLPLNGFSQVAVGEWRTHFSYRNVEQVAWTGRLVFATAYHHLFSYDPLDGSVDYYTTQTGLSGNECSFVRYSKDASTLLVVYSDGNMDLFHAGEIYSLPDYKNKVISADKTVYQVRVEGQTACLSTGIGLLTLDLRKREIKAAYHLRIDGDTYTAVADACVNANLYYVLRKESSDIYVGNSQNNLLDGRYWTRLSFVEAEKPLQLSVWNDCLYVLCQSGAVYACENGAWNCFCRYPSSKGMEVQGPYLVLYTNDSPIVLDQGGHALPLPDRPASSLAYNAQKDEWFAAGASLGLMRWSYHSAASRYEVLDENIAPNGPGVNTAWAMFAKDDAVYAVSGGRWDKRYDYLGDIMRFKDGEWISLINRDSVEAATGLPFRDIVNLAIDPANEQHFYATSWGEGLYEFTNGVLDSLHSMENAPFHAAWNGLPRQMLRVDGATFDKEGNLWVLESPYPEYSKNNHTPKGVKGLHVLMKNGEWKSPDYSNFPVPEKASSITWNEILFTSRQQIWMNSERVTYGIYVIDSKGTPGDFSDDETRWIYAFTDQDGINMDFFTVHCMVEDLNGAIWIGTTYGPVVMHNPSRIFDPSAYFTRIKVPRNDGTNEADYLLGNSRVYCIAVDGANRKWMGTSEDGVYLLSADASKTIHAFNKDNSPLPSNTIYSIAIDPNTGEVFFGTEGGIVSYRSDASQAAETYQEVHVFPNPVRPEYQGKITVTGLKENSQVKITDLSGCLLAAGRSLGGQFTWDGTSPSGQRAASGVYLVFSADEAGEESCVCKFAMIR